MGLTFNMGPDDDDPSMCHVYAAHWIGRSKADTINVFFSLGLFWGLKRR